MSYFNDLLAVIASSSIGTIVTEGWDVSTAAYASKYKSISSQDGYPVGLFFKPDGLLMYVVGRDNNRVYQYTLS